MHLIPISNEYSINIASYEKLKIGDTIKSQSQLRRMICYPKITSSKSNSGTIKRLQPIIDKFISYARISNSHKIQITSLRPPQEVKEIVETYLAAAKTNNSRQVCKHNREYILDYIINSYDDNPIYLTTYDIIKQSTAFDDFFYDYFDIHYDKSFSTKEEVSKLNCFAERHSIKDKQYLIDIMDMLGKILYYVFNSNNIHSWAIDRNIEIERVLFQRNKELSEEEAAYLDTIYFKPLRDRNLPAKSITKKANINYMKDHNTEPNTHNWFYYIFKLTKPPSFAADVNDNDFMQNKHELSTKVIEKLTSKAIDPIGGNYHKKNINNLKEILNKIMIKNQ
jgi:hypothetical protein